MKEILLKGTQKIMVSAPHCVDHFREGKMKPREVNTDKIVIELNKRKDVPGIYKVESSNEDANWDFKLQYKEACKEYIKNNNIQFFMDIHGMNYKRKEDICIGTANGKNITNNKEIVTIIKDIFLEFGYKYVSIDTPFSADSNRCVSRYISKECCIDSVQIEINNKYRFPQSNEYDLENLISCFEKIIETLEPLFDNF